MSFETPTYPGINLDDNYGPQMNTIAVVFITLSFVVVVLRFISRRETKVEIKLDDYLIIVAAVLSWGYTAGIVYEVIHNYYGQHIGKSDAAHLEEYLKGLYGIAIVYPMALTASKLSLLALYWRIFGVSGSKARIPMSTAAALNIGWMIAAVLVGIFSCNPVSGFWNLESPSTCIQEYDFFLTNECLTITLDVIVLIMPVYFISNIQRSLSQRISISSTFLLGLVVTVVSAIRLWQLVIAQQRPGNDPTFNQIAAALWAIIEVNTWVIVASIPALRPFVHKLHGQIMSKKRSGLRFTSSSLPRSWNLRSLFKRSHGSSGSRTKEGSLPLHNQEAAESTHSAPYVAQVPDKLPHEHGWTPIGPNTSVMSSGTREEIQMTNIPGLVVNPDYAIPRSTTSSHK